MKFSDYQEMAFSTAVYPDKGTGAFAYPALGLAGEAGEVSEKLKKCIRDHNWDVPPEKKAEIKKELGDVLWYVAALCTELGLRMGEVAGENLNKLFDRKDRGKLKGDGDNR